ncbi:MAG: hypothetical protein JSS66_13115 [Armatimonadetes bacterium]|nr:hypothetical protein [Armatimonadota bacterium]
MSWLTGVALLVASVQTPTVTSHENDLFKKNIGLYLTRDSWNDSLAYLHGHFMMVPLHAAMLMDQKDWQAQFEAQFNRLVNVPHDKLCKNPLSRLQYLYVGTRYLALSAKTGHKADVQDKLNTYLTDEIVDRWLNQDAIAFDHAPFHGVKERIEHKLTLVNPAKSYFSAITDEEMFLFAEAADLLTYEKKTGTRNPEHGELQDIMRTAGDVIRSRTKWTSKGGWLFDVGQWTDHPDLLYAGNAEIMPGMSQRKVNDITMDTSHFHRFALFVVSLRDAYEPGSADYKFYDKIRAGLAKQMDDVVLQKPSGDFKGYRLTNFMSGQNGVYRFGSADDIGKDKGYGPYELSGTFLLGWWSFLGDAKIDAAYDDISKSFPLGEDILMVYQGPVYKAPPRTEKSWYENGLAELFTSLGAKMPPF